MRQLEPRFFTQNRLTSFYLNHKKRGLGSKIPLRVKKENIDEVKRPVYLRWSMRGTTVYGQSLGIILNEQ